MLKKIITQFLNFAIIANSSFVIRRPFYKRLHKKTGWEKFHLLFFLDIIYHHPTTSSSPPFLIFLKKLK